MLRKRTRDWDPLAPDPSSSRAPYRLYNVGNGCPVSVDHFISVLEGHLGRAARRRPVAAQPGDMESTAADVGSLSRDFGYRPLTPVETGLARFVDWYREFFRDG